MNPKKVLLCLAAIFAIACGESGDTNSSGATIVGDVTKDGALFSQSDETSTCADLIRVWINDDPVRVRFGESCDFVISEIPTGDVSIKFKVGRIENTTLIADVKEDEFIEIAVDIARDKITITISRRYRPTDADDLPTIIDGKDAFIKLPAGLFERNLVVHGKNFTLLGASGDHLSDCAADGWSVMAGDLLVDGKEATFKNVKFLGAVRIQGKDARFIDCCFGEDLVPYQGPIYQD